MSDRAEKILLIVCDVVCLLVALSAASIAFGIGPFAVNSVTVTTTPQHLAPTQTPHSSRGTMPISFAVTRIQLW